MLPKVHLDDRQPPRPAHPPSLKGPWEPLAASGWEKTLLILIESQAP